VFSVIRECANLANTSLARKAEKSGDFFLVEQLRAKWLSLQIGFVIFCFKLLNWGNFVSFERLTQRFVCIVTVWAHKPSTVKAIVHLGVVFLALGTSNITFVASPSNGKKTQQTVVEKTAW